MRRGISRIAADPVIAYLVVAGLGYILAGLTWIVIPSRTRELGIEWIPGVSAQVVGVVWVIAGTLALAGVLGAPTRLAFIALQAWPMILGAFFLVSWVVSLMPDSVWHAGNERGYTTTISYSLISVGAYAVGRLWADREAPHAGDR